MKPKVAVFAFTSCEGCSLIMLEMEERLPDIISQVEFVNFREVIDEKCDDYDIAIIDGAITRESEVDELKAIRGRAKIVVAMGACAVQGGLYALKNFHDPEKTMEYVYGDKAGSFDTMPVRPLSHYVAVDFNIYGCPIDKKEFLEVFRSLILGKRPNIPDYPICNECRMAENICVFDRGLYVHGPGNEGRLRGHMPSSRARVLRLQGHGGQAVHPVAQAHHGRARRERRGLHSEAAGVQRLLGRDLNP